MEMAFRERLAAAGRIGREDGQTFVEYALVLVLVAVAVAVLASWTSLGTAIGDALTSVINAL